jgi:succinate dehydrogenase subunit C
MATRRPFVRPMAGWWRRDPFFMRYMAREVTSIFVAAYAIVLLVGVIRLSQGEAAFDAYLAALKSPGSIVFHALLFAVFAYHTYSWFDIMPKTMPPVVVGGKKLSNGTVTGLGIAAAVACSLVLIAVVMVLAR